MFTIAGGILIAVVLLCLAPYILTGIFWLLAAPFFLPGIIKRAVKGNPHKI